MASAWSKGQGAQWGYSGVAAVVEHYTLGKGMLVRLAGTVPGPPTALLAAGWLWQGVSPITAQTKSLPPHLRIGFLECLVALPQARVVRCGQWAQRQLRFDGRHKGAGLLPALGQHDYLGGQACGQRQGDGKAGLGRWEGGVGLWEGQKGRWTGKYMCGAAAGTPS